MSCWSEPNTKHAFVLSWISTIVTVGFAITGVVYYVVSLLYLESTTEWYFRLMNMPPLGKQRTFPVGLRRNRQTYASRIRGMNLTPECFSLFLYSFFRTLDRPCVWCLVSRISSIS